MDRYADQVVRGRRARQRARRETDSGAPIKGGTAKAGGAGAGSRQAPEGARSAPQAAVAAQAAAHARKDALARLDRLRTRRADIEWSIESEVNTCRARGATWAQIAKVLRVTTEGARKRYGP